MLGDPVCSPDSSSDSNTIKACSFSCGIRIPNSQLISRLTMAIWKTLLAAVCLVATSGSAQIVPGATWTDTSGNVIQAHGGGFLKVWNTSLACVFKVSFYFSF